MSYSTVIKLRYKEDYWFISNLPTYRIALDAFNEMVEKMIPLYGPLMIHSSCIYYRGEDFPPYISAGFIENYDEVLGKAFATGAMIRPTNESYILLKDKKENYFGAYLRKDIYVCAEDMFNRFFAENKEDHRRKEFIQKIINHPELEIEGDVISMVREMRWWPCDDDIKEQVKRNNFLGNAEWYDIPSAGVFLEPPRNR